jgi:hypothetical protein
MPSNEQRIEGEFHYATLEINGWAIHRKDGMRNVGWVYGWFRNDGWGLIDFYDRQARHFTALAIQGERERVNGLAAELADHTQDLIASSPGQNTPLWTVYGLHDVEEGTTGDTFLEALEAAATPSVERNDGQ